MVCHIQHPKKSQFNQEHNPGSYFPFQNKAFIPINDENSVSITIGEVTLKSNNMSQKAILTAISIKHEGTLTNFKKELKTK